MSMILFVYIEAYFNNNNLDSFIPSIAISLLHNFDDDIRKSNSDLSLFFPIVQHTPTCINFLLDVCKYSFFYLRLKY
jgi:hypothetical protein